MIGIQRRAGAAVAAMSLLLVGAGCSQPVPTKGDASGYAKKYVTTLNTSDEGSLKKLLNNPQWPDDAKKRIAAVRGRSWLAGEPVVTELTEGSYRVTIPVTADGAAQSWELTLGTRDGKLSAGPRE